jgi:hypothetical protein
MTRFTWNSVRRKIQEHAGLTRGLRAKADALAENMEQDMVTPPTVDFSVPGVAVLVWAKGTNTVRIAVHPKGPPKLIVLYRNNDFQLVADIANVLASG